MGCFVNIYCRKNCTGFVETVNVWCVQLSAQQIAVWQWSQCDSDTVWQWDSETVWQWSQCDSGRSVTVIQWYSVTVRQCDSDRSVTVIAVWQWYSVTVRQCDSDRSVTVIQCDSETVIAVWQCFILSVIVQTSHLHLRCVRSAIETVCLWVYTTVGR